MRTFAMMLGEIDFIATYVQPYYKPESDTILPFPMPTFLILALFMVFMPILLMNLLIGLAVGDIESVRRNAQLKRLAMQVRNNICYLSTITKDNNMDVWNSVPTTKLIEIQSLFL